MPLTIEGIDIAVGPLAYGLWRFAGTDVKTAQAKLEQALACGMTLIDTADVYGYNGRDGFGDAERLQGQVMKASPALRDQMIVATKGGVFLPGPYRSEKDYLIKACEQSMQRLGVDVIDLYQIHRPDLLASPYEVAAALNELMASGKIKAAGVSNYTANQMRALSAYMDKPLVSVQPEISPLFPDAFVDGITDFAQETGMAVLAWSPLGGGALVDKMAAATHSDKAKNAFEVMAPIAASQGVDVWQVALKFLMMHPSKVIPILGTQTPSRIQQATAALDVKLTRVEWYSIFSAGIGFDLP